MGVVRFGLKRLLFLPFSRLEVGGLLLERSATENPGCTGWKDMDTPKQGPVLENASATNEFSKPARVDLAQLRSNLKDCLCLWCKVKGILRFVVIKPLQTEPVIEDHRRSALGVGR